MGVLGKYCAECVYEREDQERLHFQGNINGRELLRLDALESKAKPPDERRRFPRSPVKVMVHLLTWRQYEVPIEGEVVDLSTGGFGLFADTVFVVDSYITVTPANNPLGPRVEARVKSRTPLGTRWRIGCEFVQPLSDEELRIFHDSESPTNPTD